MPTILEDLNASIQDDYSKPPPGYYYWKDIEGVYRQCSKALQLLIPNDFIGKDDRELWPLYAKSIIKTDKEVIKLNSSITTKEIFPLNGEEKTFIVVKFPWVCHRGEIIGITAHLIDVTHFEKKESSIDLAKDVIAENILLCIPGSIYWKTKEGMYLGCNDFMVKEAGLKLRDEIIGKTDEDLWPSFAKSIRENDYEVMNIGKPISLEEKVNGRYFSSLKMPLRDKKQEIIGIICNSHDITHLKEIEAQLREAKERSEAANRAKSEFLAIVSHELRSPLTIILGMIHFLSVRENMVLEQKREYIDNISIAAKHLLNLVNDILDLAKLDAGQFNLSSVSLDFKQLISETITIFLPQAKAKDLEIFFNYDSKVSNVVLGDIRVLRQIIINLLNNALKFTDKGHIIVDVNAIECSPAEVTLSLSIKDTGIGIPEEKLAIIFNIFQQVDTSYRRKYQGTGLGLTITKKLLDAMGGTLQVSSEPGKGSTFTCIFTLKLQVNAISNDSWKFYESHVAILIIDDTNECQKLIDIFGGENCAIVSSQNALDVFIMNQQNVMPYGIIIINDNLKFHSPFLLSKKINECPNISKPMLIYFTLAVSSKEKEIAEGLGFFELMEKTFTNEQITIFLATTWKKWLKKNTIVPPASSNHIVNLFKEPTPVNKIQNEKRVLLIDDEKVILWVHSEILKDLGCNVTTINNSKDALKVLESDDTFDLILIDMGLPIISGPELVKKRRLKEQINGFKSPIIALTGYSSQKDQEIFLEAGVDEIYIKPVSAANFKTILKSMSHYETLV